MGVRFILSVALPGFVCGLFGLYVAAAATAADRPATSVLHLANGDFVPGELRGSEDAKVLRWRSPFFAQPLEFPLSAVTAAARAAPIRARYCSTISEDVVALSILRGAVSG